MWLGNVANIFLAVKQEFQTQLWNYHIQFSLIRGGWDNSNILMPSCPMNDPRQGLLQSWRHWLSMTRWVPSLLLRRNQKSSIETKICCWLLDFPFYVIPYVNVWCNSDSCRSFWDYLQPLQILFIAETHLSMATRGLTFIETRAPRAAGLSKRALDKHKDLIGDLYLKQNQTRDQVIQHLKTKFDFSISWVQSFPWIPVDILC